MKKPAPKGILEASSESYKENLFNQLDDRFFDFDASAKRVSFIGTNLHALQSQKSP